MFRPDSRGENAAQIPLKKRGHRKLGLLLASKGWFFYTHTVPRDWQTLAQLRVKRHKTLPDVLTTDEVRKLIDAVRTLPNKTYLWTVYSLGLRLGEGLHLQVGDIDSSRMLVHVHRGKGAKDRYVPLPPKTLAMLRGEEKVSGRKGVRNEWHLNFHNSLQANDNLKLAPGGSRDFAIPPVFDHCTHCGRNRYGSPDPRFEALRG